MWSTSSPALLALAEARSYNHTRQNFQRSSLTVYPQGLTDGLSRSYHDHEHLQFDTGVLIDRLCSESPELYPRCRYNPLKEEALRDVYQVGLRVPCHSRLGEIERNVAEAWQSKLERYLAIDQNEARMIDEPFVHRRAQHLFRALAEVCYVNRSVRLSQVLYGFFVRNATVITSAEGSATLGQWCWSVLRAVTMPSHQHACLRLVLRQRPDLPIMLRRNGHRGQEVAERLEAISGVVHGGLGVRGLLASRRSRSHNHLRSNYDDVDGMRSRSTSREDGMLVPDGMAQLSGFMDDGIALQGDGLLSNRDIMMDRRLLHQYAHRVGNLGGGHDMHSSDLDDCLDSGFGGWSREFDLSGIDEVDI